MFRHTIFAFFIKNGAVGTTIAENDFRDVEMPAVSFRTVIIPGAFLGSCMDAQIPEFGGLFGAHIGALG